MRVLHLADRLSSRGGADLHLLAVLDTLRHECETHLATAENDGTAVAPCAVTSLEELAGGDAAVVCRALDSLAATVAPDIVHIHNCMNPHVLEWGAERGAVLTVQDHRVFCPGRGKLMLVPEVCHEPMSQTQCAGCFTDDHYFERILTTTAARLDGVRKMSAVIVLSEYMKSELVAVDVHPERIVVISPFVHGLDRDAAPSGPPCVLFAGRLVAAKGVLDALEVHRRSGIALPLVFAGTGSERARLEAAGCEVLGWVPHAELASVYRRAAALIMPSRWQEPFGLSALEALTMGVPVVAWASGGLGEWLPAAASWGDIDGLAAALRAAVGTRARPPSGFDCATVTSRLLTLYESRLAS